MTTYMRTSRYRRLWGPVKSAAALAIDMTTYKRTTYCLWGLMITYKRTYYLWGPVKSTTALALDMITDL
jgi:hypothetical protein